MRGSFFVHFTVLLGYVGANDRKDPIAFGPLLEVEFLSHEAELIDAATNFVADVIAFSEPLGSECAGPEPNMLSYEVDDAAMYEAAEQQRLDHLADEDYYEPPDDYER